MTAYDRTPVCHDMLHSAGPACSFPCTTQSAENMYLVQLSLVNFNANQETTTFTGCPFCLIYYHKCTWPMAGVLDLFVPHATKMTNRATSCWSTLFRNLWSRNAISNMSRLNATEFMEPRRPTRETRFWHTSKVLSSVPDGRPCQASKLSPYDLATFPDA